MNMEQVGKKAMELATKLYHQQPPTGKQEKSISEDTLKVTGILWDKFTTGYQHLWSNTYGVIGGDEYHSWAKALSTVDPKKVMAAIARSIKECHDYPPNLIKFLRFCREEKPAMYNSVALPKPPIDRKAEVYMTEKEKCIQAAKELGVLK